MELFLQKNRLKAELILGDTVSYLVKKYKQVNEVFTYATSFGQVVLVLYNINNILLYYLQDSINETNINTAQRAVSVQGIASLNGHSAMRGKSAVGEIMISLKSGVNVSSFMGNYVFIPNFIRIQCLNNGFTYLLNLSSDDVVFDLTKKSNLYVRIIEGKLDVAKFTGTGADLQTYNVPALPGQMIEDDFVEVYCNGSKYEKYVHLYDIPYKKRGCLVRTGLNSGVDVIFYTDFYTTIPKLGEEIQVHYLLTNGASGNVYDSLIVYKFLDTGFDNNGAEVNLEELFDITPISNPDFGADAEGIELTRLLAPNISRNFIMHDERSIRYFLERMNYFSTIKIFKNKDNIDAYTYDLLLLPKIDNRLVASEDYFSAPLDKFFMSTEEKVRLLSMINESGAKSTNISLNMFTPTVRKACLHIFVDAFKRYGSVMTDEGRLIKDIRSKLSSYLLSNKRSNKIAHSDIVKLVDDIPAIDTVKAVFSPENPAYLDSLGNFSVADREVAMIRGGWKDANGVVYADEFNPPNGANGSVNIIITYVEDYS